MKMSTRDVFAAFDTDLSVKFKGIIKANNILNVVYPKAFEINRKKSGNACTVSLDQGKYAGSCALVEGNRTLVIKGFASREYDFTTPQGKEDSGGKMIQIRLTNMFVNPVSEQPVDAGFSLHLRDSHVHNVAAYNASQFTSENRYAA